MVMTTISSKFELVIPKEVRDKLHLSPKQRLHVMVKGGIITLVPKCLSSHYGDGSKGCPRRTCVRGKTDPECRAGSLRVDRSLHRWSIG